MPEIMVPHDGGDQLVFLARGVDPVPLHLSENDTAEDLNSMVTDRERAVLAALLKFALDKLNSHEPTGG